MVKSRQINIDIGDLNFENSILKVLDNFVEQITEKILNENVSNRLKNVIEIDKVNYNYG